MQVYRDQSINEDKQHKHDIGSWLKSPQRPQCCLVKETLPMHNYQAYTISIFAHTSGVQIYACNFSCLWMCLVIVTHYGYMINETVCQVSVSGTH